MGKTGPGGGRFARAALGLCALGAVAAYAAAAVAFGYALVSLYWALGGRGLISTVGGYAEQFAHGGGVVAVLVAVAVAVAKVAGGLLALVLVRPWGRVIPRGWLLIVSAGTSVLLVVYGGLNVTAGALVLWGVIHPAGAWTGPHCAGTLGSGICGSWCGGSCWRWQPRAIGSGRQTRAPELAQARC